MRSPVCLELANELPAAGAALLLEAIVAVHWLVAAREERHLGLLATTRARGAEHFAWSTIAAGRGRMRTEPIGRSSAVHVSAFSAAGTRTTTYQPPSTERRVQEGAPAS